MSSHNLHTSKFDRKRTCRLFAQLILVYLSYSGNGPFHSQAKIIEFIISLPLAQPIIRIPLCYIFSLNWIILSSHIFFSWDFCFECFILVAIFGWMNLLNPNIYFTPGKSFMSISIILISLNQRLIKIFSFYFQCHFQDVSPFRHCFILL